MTLESFQRVYVYVCVYTEFARMSKLDEWMEGEHPQVPITNLRIQYLEFACLILLSVGPI